MNWSASDGMNAKTDCFEEMKVKTKLQFRLITVPAIQMSVKSRVGPTVVFAVSNCDHWWPPIQQKCWVQILPPNCTFKRIDAETEMNVMTNMITKLTTTETFLTTTTTTTATKDTINECSNNHDHNWNDQNHNHRENTLKPQNEVWYTLPGIKVYL